jgi:hypothetical protein
MSFESTLFPPEHEEPAHALHSETAGNVDLLLGEGFSLPALLENVARYYLERAIEQADGKKTAAARLVGLPSYQTFTNWVARYKAQPGNSRTGSMSSRHEEGRDGRSRQPGEHQSLRPSVTDQELQKWLVRQDGSVPV